jgi:hypothetical protein
VQGAQVESAPMLVEHRGFESFESARS